MSKYTTKLAKNNIVILGGTSGIGFGVAEAAVEFGANVTISGSSEEKLQRALTRLREAYPQQTSNIHGHTCDLSKIETQEANVRKLLESATTTAKLDHVVMTAGDGLDNKPITEFTADLFFRASTVRFIGSAVLAKLLPEFIVPGPGSSLTLTGGTNTDKPRPV